MNEITIKECREKYQEGYYTVISNGNIERFEKEQKTEEVNEREKSNSVL